MKFLYTSSYLLPCLATAALTGCLELKLTVKPRANEKTVPSETISLTPRFASPTGWTNNEGQPIKISIRADFSSSFTLQCRTAPLAVIESTSFGSCTSPSEVRPTAGTQNNGTYRTEVRAINGPRVLDHQHFDYYVHPSLNALAACPEVHSDEWYFEQAGAYLDQHSEFGSHTSLKGPFVNLEVHENQGHSSKMIRNITLRKAFVANEANTMILLKRRFVGQSGHCQISVKGVRSTRELNQVDDDLGAPADSVRRRFSYRNNSESPHIQLGGVSTIIDSTRYNRIPRAGSWSSYAHYSKSGHHAKCTAVVFNAHAKAICFDATGTSTLPVISINNFAGQLAVMPAPVYPAQKLDFSSVGSVFDLNAGSTVTNLRFSSRVGFAPKFRKKDQAYFNNLIHALATNVGQNHPSQDGSGPGLIPMLLLED